MEWLPVPALGGVNLFDDPRAIRDEEVQLARNLVPARPGILKKRGGLVRPVVPNPSMYESGGINTPSTAVVTPFKASNSTDDIDMVVAWRGKNRVVLAGWAITGTTGSLTTPFDHPRVPLLAWNNKVYALPGPNAAWSTIAGAPAAAPSQAPFYVYDNTVDFVFVTTAIPVSFQGSGNENVYPAYAFPYKQRLVLANFGKGYENTIAFTDDYTANVVGNDILASNTRSINLVAGADGDEIVAGIEVMLTNVGSPAESGLLILRRYGDPFLLTGDMDQTTGGQSTLDIKRISVKCGCAGQYTVARTPVGIIWAGADDVWCFAAGVLPRRLGQKIQPALKLTPAQLQFRWSAAFFDGFYRLAVWGAGQGMTQTDAPGDQWWLDLRDGLPQDWREARWWGPQQFLGGATAGVAPVPATWHMIPETRAGKDAKLFYLDYALNSGVSSTVVGEYGTDTRDMTSPVASIADADYVDPEVTAELITKEYTLAPGRDQINDGLMFVVRPSNDLTINADFVIDDGDQVLTRTKRLGDTSSFQLDAAPLDATAPAFGPFTGKVLKTALYPLTRRAGQTHRFRIYDTAGYTIVQGINDTLVVLQLDDIGGDNYQWVATVTPGTYTLTTLASAVLAAINAARVAAIGSAFGVNWAVALVGGAVQFSTSWPTSVTIGFAFVSVTPDFGTTPTAAQIVSSCRLAAALGYAVSTTSVTSASSATPTLTGDPAFKKAISDWEIYGIAANMEVLPRTP